MKASRLLLVMLLSIFAAAQSNNQCLIVKQNKGHQVRNMFLFGIVALPFSRGERFEYVDAINFPQSKMKYKGDELQKIKESGVHIIVVTRDPSGDEVEAARSSCQAEMAAPGTKPAKAKNCDKNPAECWWPKQ